LWETAIATVAVIFFAPAVWGGWVYDDQMEIVLNPLVQSLSHIPMLFRTTVWAGSGMETYLYRPLALVTYALNHAVSGLDPWSYHLVNVLLHALASVLVFRLGRRWGLTLPAAGLGGMFFALNPVHVEVVAAVFGRKDLLAAVFTLTLLLLHETSARRGGWRMALPVVAYACAMLSKEVGVVGLLLVAAQDWFLTRDRSHLARDRRRARLYVAYIGALLLYVLVRNAVTGGVGVPETYYMDNPLVGASLPARLATALAVVGKGVALQLLPLHLSPDYSYNAIPLVRSVLDWRFLGTLAGILLWILALSRVSGDSSLRSGAEGRTHRLPSGLSPAEAGELDARPSTRAILLLASAWYVISLLPSANVVVTVGTIFGERLLYLPSVALTLVMGMAVTGLTGQSPALAHAAHSWEKEDSGPGPAWARTFALGATMVWAGALGYQTVSYSRAWDNDISLFRWAVASVPSSTKAQHKLGEELLRADRVGEALPHLRKALAIAPDNQFAAATLARARERLAQRYLSPSAGDAVPSPPDDPEILYTLGSISYSGGDRQQAARYWTRALVVDSTHAPSQLDLGALRLIQGDTVAALQHLQAAVRARPEMAEAWFNLARVYLARGDLREARTALTRFVASAGRRFPDQVRWAGDALSGLPAF
jgi:Flp pilus assembly protein TadD